jgi:hypothetical protein
MDEVTNVRKAKFAIELGIAAARHIEVETIVGLFEDVDRHRSTIITSQVPIEHWEVIAPNTMTFLPTRLCILASTAGSCRL